MSGSVIGGFLGYLFHFIISRKLSVGQYGELQSLVSIFAILGVFPAALSYFVIKYSSVFAKFKDYRSNKEFIKLLNSKIIRLNTFLFLLFLLCVPLIGKFLHTENYFGLIIIGIAAVFSAAATVYRGMLTGWEEFGKVSLIGILGALAKLASGFLIVIFFPAASAVIIAFLITGIAGWILAKAFSKKKYFTIRKEKTTESDWQSKYFSRMNIKKSIVPIFIFSLALILISNIDIILVKNLTSSELTGYYGALSVLGKIILWLNLAVVGVILPNACANGQGKKSVSRKILFSAYGLIFLISFSAAGLYFLFPTFVISLLFGAKYAVFHSDLWLFAVMALALSLLTLESNFAYARHDFKISYILLGIAILMALSIYFFHATIREVVIGITISFAVGYLAALAKGRRLSS